MPPLPLPHDNSLVLVYVLVIIAVFLLIREFWCWYFKINRIVRALERIAVAAEQNAQPTGNAQQPIGDTLRCTACGWLNRADARYCARCGAARS